VAQYIAKQPEWEFDKEYVEKAVSGYHNRVDERVVLQEIMRDAKNHEFDILLTYMSDRIGRQEEYSFYVAGLNRLGIEVWTIKDGQLKTEEHIDKLLNYIRFWQNEGESKKTSMRVHDSMVEMVKAGKFVGGKAPFGYRLVLSGEVSNHGRALHTLEVVPEQAKIVRKIFAYATNQGMGYQKIAKTLNAEGIKAPILDEWKNGTIRSILTNPIYMGYIAYGRRKGGHESWVRLDRKDWIYSDNQIPELVIVSEQTWQRAQEIRESRKRKLAETKQQSSDLYEEQYHVPFTTRGRLALTGIAYCGYCGKKLKNSSYANHWVRKKTGEKKVSFVGRYICPNNCKPRSCYSQEYLESIVFDAVGSYLEKLKSIDITEELSEMQRQQTKSMDRELKNIEKEQRAIAADMKTLEEKIPAAIRGEFVFRAEKLSEMIQEKDARNKELEQTKGRLQKQVQDVVLKKEELEQFVSIMPKWDEVFAEADAATKQMLLSSLIDKIIVKDDDITIRFKIRLDDFCDDSLRESGGAGTTP
jgi:DNA invertase Pin-like site-specific DNA recombinase